MNKKKRFTNECVAHRLEPSCYDKEKLVSVWSTSQCIKTQCELYSECAVYENWEGFIK